MRKVKVVYEIRETKFIRTRMIIKFKSISYLVAVILGYRYKTLIIFFLYCCPSLFFFCF